MINIHFCLNFIKHYWSATRIDVLHSPFIFDLYNTCIKPKQPDKDSITIEQLRSALKKDQRIIEQVDLGAGALSSPVKQKRVAQFASQHAKPPRIAQIIYRLVKYYRYNHIIELGTSLGISSCYLASAVKSNFSSTESHFTTIEGAPAIAGIASENIKKLGLETYTQQRIGNFDDVLPDLLTTYPAVDVAFIDGNHRYQPTIDYFNQLLPHVHNNSVLIFDDIYWSKEMTQAWKEIKQHSQVTVTVDLFFIGLVFFRKEQVKEHFRLRVW